MPITNDSLPNPPSGFASWLEYVVQNFDYRLAAVPFLFDRDPVVTQQAIANAVQAEWHELKARANHTQGQ